jgi:Putative lactococcus lactis phage r1t holin
MGAVAAEGRQAEPQPHAKAGLSFSTWWRGALERVGKTVAQTLATRLIGVGLAMITFTAFRNAAIVALFAGLGALVVSRFTVTIANRGLGGGIESFAANTAIRCVFTFGETLAGLVTVAKGFNYITFAWPSALGQATVAALLSILTSVASSASGEPNSPSLIRGAK